MLEQVSLTNQPLTHLLSRSISDCGRQKRHAIGGTALKVGKQTGYTIGKTTYYITTVRTSHIGAGTIGFRLFIT
jgi:hypothetical protein